MKKILGMIKKDSKIDLFGFLVIILMIIGWDIFLFYKVSNGPDGVRIIMSLIPLLIVPFIILRNGYVSMKKEWDTGTIYLLMSLPVRGGVILISKFIVSFIYYMLTVILTFSLSNFLFKKDIEFLSQFTDMVDIKRLTYLLFGILLYIGLVYFIIGQTTYLISKLYKRFNRIISLIIGMINFYLVFRIGSFLGETLFSGISNYEIKFRNEILTIINFSPLMGSLIIILILFFINSWLFEKHLEV